jgi:hypothetical protein
MSRDIPISHVMNGKVSLLCLSQHIHIRNAIRSLPEIASFLVLSVPRERAMQLCLQDEVFTETGDKVFL